MQIFIPNKLNLYIKYYACTHAFKLFIFQNSNFNLNVNSQFSENMFSKYFLNVPRNIS